MAPEVAGRPHRHVDWSDTWTLSCTVVNLASGQLPWEDADALGRTNELMAIWLAAQGRPPLNTPPDGAAPCFEPARRARARDIRGELSVL
jgi:hypothetical protein